MVFVFCLLHHLTLSSAIQPNTETLVRFTLFNLCLFPYCCFTRTVSLARSLFTLLCAFILILFESLTTIMLSRIAYNLLVISVWSAVWNAIWSTGDKHWERRKYETVKSSQIKGYIQLESRSHSNGQTQVEQKGHPLREEKSDNLKPSRQVSAPLDSPLRPGRGIHWTGKTTHSVK